MRYVGDHDLALDVLQETFSYLLRKFPPTGDGLTLRARLTTLLYPVAKNSAISQLRKQHRFRRRRSIPMSFRQQNMSRTPTSGDC